MNQKILEGYWVSYQGEIDIVLNQVKYAIRYAAPKKKYRPGVFEANILPLVGTVRFAHSPLKFPPSEIIQWVKRNYGPSFVGARYIFNISEKVHVDAPLASKTFLNGEMSHAIVYSNPPPVVRFDPNNSLLPFYV